MGEQQLKNIAQPVRVYRLGAPSGTSVRPTAVERIKPSIAVLPFTNMSGDPGQQYISDGITEDIITELARFRGLSVVARHASFHFANKGKSHIEVARELGVAYVVEGSLRKLGDRIRITAQLVDARTGNHVWADRYDRDAQDIFAIQDLVVAAIVTMLEGRMYAAEAAKARAKPTTSWSAYDCLLQGRDLCDHQRDAEVAECPAECQHGAGHDSPRGERKRDRPEHAPLGASESERRLLEPSVHRLEAGLRGLDEEGARSQPCRQHRRPPCEGELDSRRVENATNGALAADQDEEVVAEHRRRQDERQHDDGFREVAAWKALEREHPRQRHPRRHGQDGGRHGDLERKPEREEVHAA